MAFGKGGGTLARGGRIAASFHGASPRRGTRRALLVPTGAVVRQGDLTGVRIVAAGVATLRWIKLGGARGSMVEVLSGLAAGDTVLVADGTR